MFGFKIDQARSMFFDRAAVTGAMDRKTRRVFSRFGAFVRTRARSSIRRRKRVSTAGAPPSAHTKWLKMIFFAYDAARQSVVIGPVKLNRIGNAPEALEYGGQTRIKVAGSRRRRRRFRTVSIAARPYMQPAFDEERPKLSGMYAGQVK